MALNKDLAKKLADKLEGMQEKGEMDLKRCLEIEAIFRSDPSYEVCANELVTACQKYVLFGIVGKVRKHLAL